MNTLATTVRNRLSPKPWAAPVLDQPIVIGVDELVPLGRDRRGRDWFAHRLGELEESRTVRPTMRIDIDGEAHETTEPPNGPVVQVIDPETGARSFRTFRIHQPGAYAEQMNASTIAKPAALPASPVDALDAFDRLRGVRGADQVLAWLHARGVTLIVVDDDVVDLAPGGRPYPGVDAVIAAAVPLLLPYLRDGEAPQCWTGCGREAITVARGRPHGKPWCGQCAVTLR